jgi:phosphatidylglycerol---prolipoprotein diacylglyceryl transferase
MLPFIKVFGLTIQAGPLAIVLGLMAGLSVAGRLAAHRGLDGEAVSSAGFYGALVGVLGARAGYVLLNLPAYAREPLSALMPNTTALWPWSGWVIGLAFAAWYLWRKGVLPKAPLALLDALAPGLAVFALGLAAASFLDGYGFGTESALPWSVYLWGALRHPVQLYECAALMLILAVLLVAERREPRGGALLLLFVALYGAARVLVDGFRADAALVAGL